MTPFLCTPQPYVFCRCRLCDARVVVLTNAGCVDALQVAALFERVLEEQHGRLDILVNSAWGGNELDVTQIMPFWQMPLQVRCPSEIGNKFIRMHAPCSAARPEPSCCQHTVSHSCCRGWRHQNFKHRGFENMLQQGPRQTYKNSGRSFHLDSR